MTTSGSSKESKKRIILATQSESRKKSFALLGLKFETIVSKLDESKVLERNPKKRVKILSELKATEVAKKVKNAVVVGADLIVFFKGKIYEKPKDVAEAYRMLKSFSGHRVQIIAGVTVVDSNSGKKFSKVKSCTVKFTKLEENQIENYINNYPVLNFSGAFDGNAVLMFAERIQGDALFYSGIPLLDVYKMLKKLGAIDAQTKRK